LVRVLWATAFAAWGLVAGPTRDRYTVIFWIVTALIAFTIGTRPWWQAPADWSLIIVFFLAYDYTRGMADRVGLPTSWNWMIDFDRALAGGQVPTVWLQERFAAPPDSGLSWEVLPSVVHLTHFFVPFILGGVLWWQSRTVFGAYMLRLGLASAIGLVMYVIVPAAPPWAAARCSAEQVISHPSDPPCLEDDDHMANADDGLLGAFESKVPSDQDRVERITLRGWGRVPGLQFTEGFVKTGIDGSNKVAAIPSLHAAGAFLTAAFLWRRVRRRWHPLLVAYPIAMALALVWGGDHYLVDVLLGGLTVVLAFALATKVERALRLDQRMSRPGGRGGLRHWRASRKVRTPQSAVVANSHPR
jgi:hypothetical protein